MLSSACAICSLALPCPSDIALHLQAIVDRAAELNIAVANPMGRLRKEEHA
jgi:hypothetical protein